MAFERFSPISKEYTKPIKYTLIALATGYLAYQGVKLIQKCDISSKIRSQLPTTYIQESFKPLNSLESTYEV